MSLLCKSKPVMLCIGTHPYLTPCLTPPHPRGDVIDRWPRQTAHSIPTPGSKKTKFIVRRQQQPANADASSTGSTDKARSLPSWRWQLDEVCLSGFKPDMSVNLRKLHSIVQGKFVFRLNWVIEAYEGVEVHLHRFFLGARWSERSATRTGRYKPGGSNLLYPLCCSRRFGDEIKLFRTGKISIICRSFGHYTVYSTPGKCALWNLNETKWKFLRRDMHAPGGIRTNDLSKRATADLRLRPRGHWDRHLNCCTKLNNLHTLSTII